MSMYLLTPTEIAQALQRSNCRADDTTVDSLAMILLMAQTRIEEALEVASLEYGTFTDVFEVTDANVLRREVRLVNAFLDPSMPIVLARPGIAIDPDDDPYVPYKVVPDTGILTLDGLGRGQYGITYSGGFKKDADNYAQDVPEWIKTLCVTMVLHWYRVGMLSPAVPENVSYAALINSAVREIMTRKYMRYDRPRYGVIFTDRGYYGASV